MKLRDYQVDLVEKILDSWNRGIKNVLVQLYTGGGRTVILSEVCRIAYEAGERIAIVAHREELIQQAHDKLQAFLPEGTEIGVIKSGIKPNLEAPIQVVSVGTLQGYFRNGSLPKVGLIVIDEAHRTFAGQYARIFLEYPYSRILGVTATPCRTDGEGLDLLSGGVEGYQELIQGPSFEELKSQGFLCPFKVFVSRDLIPDPDKRGSGADYSQAMLQDFVRSHLQDEEVFAGWQQYCSDRRTLVFAAGVEHSRSLTDLFVSKGIAAAHLDGSTPKDDRHNTLQQFRDGEIQVLFQYEIAVEGLDIPWIDAILCCRPTKSLRIAHQLLGRGLRPWQGKDHLVVVDFTRTFSTLPWPQDVESWSLKGQPKNKSRRALQCPECGYAIVPTPEDRQRLLAECPECGTMVPVSPPRKKSPPSGEGKILPASFLRELRRDRQRISLSPVVVPRRGEAIPKRPYLSYALDLLHEAKQRGYQSNWIFYRLIDRRSSDPRFRLSLGDFRFLCQAIGYKRETTAFQKWVEYERYFGNEDVKTYQQEILDLSRLLSQSHPLYEEVVHHVESIVGNRQGAIVDEIKKAIWEGLTPNEQKMIFALKSAKEGTFAS
jgi:superfamily II DNA or RNA helicase